MWTLFPMNPVMRRLGWGVFLLLWPLNLGDGQWMTLVTGLAGGFLLLLALWRLRDAVGLAYGAALLTETGEDPVSQRHPIDQGGETRQLKNAVHPLGRNRHPRRPGDAAAGISGQILQNEQPRADNG